MPRQHSLGETYGAVMEFMIEQQISARDTTVSCMQISITVLLIHTHLLHIFSIRTSLERRIAQLQLGAPAKKRKSQYILVDEALDRLRDISTSLLAFQVLDGSCSTWMLWLISCMTLNIDVNRIYAKKLNSYSTCGKASKL